MKRLSLFLVLGLFFSGISAVQEIIPNKFYKSKIPDRPIYLIMERLSGENIDNWKEYAAKETYGQFANDGNQHFKKVLHDVSYENNEVWVTYATTNKDQEYNELQKRDMLIFMSVTSHPDALVTTHMGISRASDAGRNPVNSRGLSMHLHSFAAKVMLQRNSERKLMVTAPAYAMTRIMNKHLPKEAIFIGTKKQQQNRLLKKDITYQEYEGQFHVSDKEKEKIEKRVKKISERNLKYYQDLLGEDSLDDILEDFKDDESAQKVLVFEDGRFKISKEKLAEYKMRIMPKPDQNKFGYDKFGIVIWLNNEVLKMSYEDFYYFLNERPPIISLGQDLINIYHPENVEKLLAEGRKESGPYQWLFKRVFMPAGITVYTAVDLKVLAESQSIE